MKLRNNFKVIIFGILILFLSACGSSDTTDSSGEEENTNKLEIYTTVYPLAFFADRIGGDHVEVTSILPAGSDPHIFEPTSKTMVDLAEADAFIYNGANLEAFAAKIESSLASEDVTILEATQGVNLSEHVHEDEEEHAHEEEENHEEEEHAHEEEENHEEEEHAHEEEEHAHEEEENHEEEHAHEEEENHEEEDHAHEEEENHEEEEHAHEEEENHEEEEHINEDGHDHSGVDPHTWLDPIRAIKLAENIKETLIDLNPEAEDEFTNNFEALKTELQSLDQKFHEKIEASDRKEILVSHAAYGYWEESYGLDQIAITGLSSSEEPSQKELETIINRVRTDNINYLLFEQNIEPKVATVIQQETGVESLQLHNLSVLTDEDIEANEDYFSLMERNLDVLDIALTE